METPYIPPAITQSNTLIAGNAYSQVVRPNGAQATVRLNGSSSPASNYVLVTAQDSRVTTKQGARQYEEGNDYKLTLVRTQTAQNTYWRVRSVESNSSYQDIQITSGNTRFRGAAGNALSVVVEYGEELAYYVTPEDSWETPIVIRITITEDTTMEEFHDFLDDVKDSTQYQISTRRGNAAHKPQTGTYAPARTGRDAIAAGATYDAETKTITLAAAASQTLTGASTAIGGLDGFGAAVVGTGTTTLEAVFAGRAFTGGVTESAQEVVLWPRSDVYAVAGRTPPTSTTQMSMFTAKRRYHFYLPPGEYLYCRSQSNSSVRGSVDVYPSDNVAPNLTFHQGGEVRRA